MPDRPGMWSKLLYDRRSGAAAACVALLGFGALALLFSLPGYRPSDFLMRRLQRRLPHLPETEVLPHLRRMAEISDDGLAAVVDLLENDNEALATAAQTVLSEHLDRWRLLPVEDSAPRAIRLAQSLSDHKTPRSARSRQFAGDLAMQLLLWPTPDASQAEELTSICEGILRGFAQNDLPAEANTVSIAAEAIELPTISVLPRQPVSLSANEEEARLNERTRTE